jgi:hypothetical protein
LLRIKPLPICLFTDGYSAEADWSPNEHESLTLERWRRYDGSIIPISDEDETPDHCARKTESGRSVHRSFQVVKWRKKTFGFTRGTRSSVCDRFFFGSTLGWSARRGSPEDKEIGARVKTL